MPLGAALGGAVGEAFGLRAAFVVAALLHVPLLLGFRVVSDARMEAAEAAVGTDADADADADG